jgi:hypothetical protein
MGDRHVIGDGLNLYGGEVVGGGGDEVGVDHGRGDDQKNDQQRAKQESKTELIHHLFSLSRKLQATNRETYLLDRILKCVDAPHR